MSVRNWGGNVETYGRLPQSTVPVSCLPHRVKAPWFAPSVLCPDGARRAVLGARP